MKTKMSVIQNSLPALTELAQKALPASAAFRVAMVIKAINTPITAFDETRAKLLKEVGEENLEKPGEYKIVDVARWQAEMTAMVDQEVEVVITPIKISEFHNANVEPKILVALDWCIEA